MVGCSDPVMRPCAGVSPAPLFGEEITRKSLRHRRFLRVSRHEKITHRDTAMPTPPGLRRVMAEGAGRNVRGRSAGCPRRYCGCGASLYLFGKIIPSLNLAANWLRFPRTAPAPGMVAARRGHVFVLKRHIRGKVWLVHHDSNSGRGKARVHPRSIAGFQTVDPRGS
nr:hypothetical protein [Nitrobacter hamburgensis]